VPIAIASFFGSIFSGTNRNEPARISVAIVDQDDSTISHLVLGGAEADKNLRVSTSTVDEARDLVKRGKISVGVVIPKGFGERAGQAFFGNGDKPPLDVLYDPSRNIEVAMVRGIMTEHIMQAVSREMFGGEQGRVLVQKALPEIEASKMPDDQKKALVDMLKSVNSFYSRPGAGTDANRGPRGITMPYTVHEQAVTSGENVAYNGYAHSFAGMGIQFLLFAAANLGIEILLERQRGLWRRLRSAPISRITLLGGKMASMTIVCLMTLLVSFTFAIVMFGVRVQGSLLGFLGISLACSIMAASFGLLIAALGKTPAATRGVTTLAVLMMVMLGGAWVPTFIFPQWLQQLTVIVPARWAVDGLDAMTWRGIGLSGAVVPVAVLLGFALLFWGIAMSRFRWEEA
jgi:ABC-2 type transport system permease protein